MHVTQASVGPFLLLSLLLWTTMSKLTWLVCLQIWMQSPATAFPSQVHSNPECLTIESWCPWQAAPSQLTRSAGMSQNRGRVLLSRTTESAFLLGKCTSTRTHALSMWSTKASKKQSTAYSTSATSLRLLCDRSKMESAGSGTLCLRGQAKNWFCHVVLVELLHPWCQLMLQIRPWH